MSKNDINLWVDDERDPPGDDWIVARTYNEAFDVIVKGDVDIISLDHDLGDYDEEGNELTGYTIARVIEEMTYLHGCKYAPKVCYIHTANPVGAQRIAETLIATCNRHAPHMSIRRVDAEEFKKNWKNS